MFKLKKILNGSRINVPETVKIQINSGEKIDKGSLYYVTTDGITKTKPAANIRSYKIIALESAPEDMAEEFIKCFIVTEDMVFESKIEGDANDLYTGQYVAFAASSGGYTKIYANEGSDALVLSTEELMTRGVADIKILTN